MNQDDSTKVFKYLYQNVTNFDSKEEFDRFYLRNKEEIDKMTTNSLNIKYKIKGFRFGRRNGELMLFPSMKNEEKTTQNNEFVQEQMEKLSEMQSKFDEMASKLNETPLFSEEQLKQITDVINKKLSEDFKKINIKLKDLNDRLLEVEGVIDQICNPQRNY